MNTLQSAPRSALRSKSRSFALVFSLAAAVSALTVMPAFTTSGAAYAGGTLFERIGGEAKLRATVDEFVKIMEDDPRINFTFANTDLKIFSRLLYEQLCNLAEGPCKYTGRDMKTSHAKLNINNAEFNALAEDLYAAFDRVNVPYRLQNEMMVLLAPMQKDIVK